MVKKLVSLALCAIMLLSTVGVIADEKPINVVIDGQAMEFSDLYGYPVDHNDRIMLPFRQIFEKYSWTAYYDGEQETVFAVKDNRHMAMQVGSLDYIYDSGRVTFDVAPISVNNRTLIPVRVISEILGYTVDYDEATRTVLIDTSTGK